MRYLNYEELGIKDRLSLITLIIGFFSCFFLFYVNSVSMLQPHANRGMIIGAALLIVFLKFPFSKTHPILRWTVDGLLLIITILCYGYVVHTADDIVYRLGDPSMSDMLVYLPGTLLCLEATRRTTGLPLTIVAACFILYAHFGHYLPGFFSHAHLDYARVADAIFLGIDGLFGPTTHAMISMIWFFLIFGIFLGLTGAGRAFIDFAFSLTGHRRGGAAQAAVLSSLLYGFVSGSGVASVATMGTFTIPLIKSGGYKAHFAGGVEAAAAMGAQVTPPVMGGTAFLISAVTGITYITICKASFIPAVLYFFCIFMCIYFEAGRLGLFGLPREQVPRMNRLILLRATVPLSSIVVMVGALILGLTPRVAAILAVLWLVIVGFSYREMKMNPAIIIRGLSEGFNSGAGLAAILATAGVCVGVVTVTGIGMKFSALVVSIGQANLVYAITAIMLASLLLGMGLPTPACYIILAILAAPAMIKLGAPILETHLLIFYFGVFAGLTPPVGIAFMTAAAIAEANPLKTGLAAVRIAIVGLIIPYVWIYNPEILLKGSFFEFLWALFTTTVGVVGLALANIGYSVRKKLHAWERVLFVAISLPLIFSNKEYLIVLLLLFGLLFYIHHFGLTLVPIGNFFSRQNNR